MEKKIERKENLEVVVTVTSNGDEWKKAQKKEYNKKAAKVQVPGFRPGKAPEHLVKARVNQFDVMNEALMNLVNVAYGEALQEEKLYVFTQPVLNVTKLTQDEFEATVTFCLPPVVTLGEYKGLGIACEEVSVSEEDVKNYIETLQKEHAVMEVKEGAAEMGDSVVIDFKGYIGDEAFEGGEANGYELELGSNMFIPGFEDKCVGLVSGETRDVVVTFPENYVESLKGKEAKFVVTCNDVKKKVLPAVDQDFIAELNIAEVKTVEELNEYAKKNIQAQKEQAAKNKQMEDIVNKAVENATVELPAAVIEEEQQAMLENMKKQIEQTGLTFEDYCQINNVSEDDLKAQRIEEAKKNLKAMLVVENIIAKENIIVTDEKLEAEYARLASQYGMDVKSVRQALESNKENFKRQLRNQLFTEFMLANN